MRTTTIAAIAGAISVALSTVAMAGNMSHAQFKDATRNIESEDKSARAGCAPLRANAKKVCIAEADGGKAIAMAELAAAYQPSQKASHDVRIAKAQADYSVAKQRCDDKAGSAKDACVTEAQAAQAAVKADATARRRSTAAYKTAQVKYAMAREQARQQLADARKDAVADKPR